MCLDAVGIPGLQAGEDVKGADQFPPLELKGNATALVVNSTPHSGQTRARMLFQILMESAHHTIDITTPYFLPDKAARRAMIRAVQDRGVRVRVLTAGRRIDHSYENTPQAVCASGSNVTL